MRKWKKGRGRAPMKAICKHGEMDGGQWKGQTCWIQRWEDKLKKTADCKGETDPSFLWAPLSGQTPDEREGRRCRQNKRKFCALCPAQTVWRHHSGVKGGKFRDWIMEWNHRPLRIIQNHRAGARRKSPASVLVTCNKHVQPRVNVRFKLTDPQKYVFGFVLTENKLWFLSYWHQSNLLVDVIFFDVCSQDYTTQVWGFVPISWFLVFHVDLQNILFAPVYSVSGCSF